MQPKFPLEPSNKHRAFSQRSVNEGSNHVAWRQLLS
jgi:hypothetical protein